MGRLHEKLRRTTSNYERTTHPQQQKRGADIFSVEVDAIIEGEGVLEMMPDGYGFLRLPIIAIFLHPMIFMFLLPKSNCLV